MNISIKLSKRAAEIIQEKEQALTYLNINAALNQAAREFRKENKKYDLGEIIKSFIS